jgi:serine/threonine protein kinase
VFVSSIQLPNLYLAGSIPESIADLAYIQTLVLSANSITGSIPSSISSLSEVLTTLDLSSNRLTDIPTEIGLLTNLIILDLDSNNFHGTLPTVLAQLTQLSQLNLRSNSFEGLFPIEFCNMTNSEVNAQDNRFTCGTSCPNIFLGDCVTPTLQHLSSGAISAIVVCCFVALAVAGVLVYRRRRFEVIYKDLPLHKLLYHGREITIAIVTENEHWLGNRDKAGHTILEAVFEKNRLELVSEEVVCYIVEKSLEKSVEEGTLLDADSLNIWVSLIQQSDDMSFSAMKAIVSRFESNVILLANGTDRLGRRCLDVASIRMREELLKCIRFLRRFELTPGPAEHKSSTSMVIIATDHGDEPTALPANKFNSIPTNPEGYEKIPVAFAESLEQHKRVVLKFMKNRDQYLSEINVRSTASLDESFVINILDHFDGGSDPGFMKAFQKRGFVEYQFCLVMPLAEITLQRVVIQRNIAGKDWDAIRHILKTLCNCLVHIHSKCIVHGDLKPNNLVLVDNAIRLIDFDASSYYGDGWADYVGAKYSTAYLPPEMFCDEGKGVKAWSCNDYAQLTSAGDCTTVGVEEKGCDYVRPCPAHDMWACGVILYLLCTGCDLFITSVEGHCDKYDQCNIFSWTHSLKAAKLSNVEHRYARNLLSLLLSKNPSIRPSAERVLMHPFISGQHSVRLQGEMPEYDLFLSYRVAADAALVELLYHALTALGLKVWWDKVGLLPGQPWEEGFCSGLVNSSCFVCLLSNNAILNTTKPQYNITTFQTDSKCDNVVLEWRLALELRERGMIEGIFPIMIGNRETTPDGKIVHTGGCHPSQQPLPECTVYSIEEKLRDHLEKQGLGSPILENMTIKEIVNSITACQGGILKGDRDAVLPNICESIRDMCSSIKKVNTVGNGY